MLIDIEIHEIIIDEVIRLATMPNKHNIDFHIKVPNRNKACWEAMHIPSNVIQTQMFMLWLCPTMKTFKVKCLKNGLITF